MKRHNVQFAFKLPDYLLDAAKAEAQARGVTTAQLVRLALADYLQHEQRQTRC